MGPVKIMWIEIIKWQKSTLPSPLLPLLWPFDVYSSPTWADIFLSLILTNAAVIELAP